MFGLWQTNRNLAIWPVVPVGLTMLDASC
jgi:hypothetical protein